MKLTTAFGLAAAFLGTAFMAVPVSADEFTPAQKTELGAFLNELGDVISDAALYLPFAIVPGISPKIVVAVVVLAIVSEMTGVLAQAVSGVRRYDGPMGKSDRAFAFSVAAIALAIWQSDAAWYVNSGILFVIAPLLGGTIANRVYSALKKTERV